jgi:hypothetical protein
LRIFAVEANFYFLNRDRQVGVLGGCWMLGYALYGYATPIFFLAFAPFFYIAWHFRPILEMRTGMYFTEAIVLILVTDRVTDGIVFFVGFPGESWGYPFWPTYFLGFVDIFGAVAVVLAYRQARSSGESRTLSLDAAIWAYMLVVGLVYSALPWLLLWIYPHWSIFGVSLTIGQKLFGMFHIVPALIMFGYRKWLLQQLGKRWLRCV